MDELTVKRNYNTLNKVMNNKKFKDMSDKELVMFINSSSDLNELDRAEQEYINRNCNPEELGDYNGN